MPLQAYGMDFQVRLPALPPARREWQLESGEGFEIDVSGCAALGPGQACLTGCRSPFVGVNIIGWPARYLFREMRPWTEWAIITASMGWR
ncbi:unnamed protein product [Symbiodinium natans]|uniref:Uncharacterized protein n=1 Tax=Symbiodinium natans TaxID=878477 RepID=A0A812RRM8_9DINO|nr:unnamed protein product [Symbiodinium natans]